MSYWTKDRPVTPRTNPSTHPHQKKQAPGEHERETLTGRVWEGHYHPEYTTTHKSDYTPKQRVERDRDGKQYKDTPPHKPRGERIWGLYTEEELMRRGLDVDGKKGDDQRSLISTTHQTYTIPNFSPTRIPPTTPAGQPTAKDALPPPHISPSLQTQPKQEKTTYGRTPTLYPLAEGHRRSDMTGVQTWSDWPAMVSKGVTRGEEMRRRQEVIGKVVVGGLGVEVAGK